MITQLLNYKRKTLVLFAMLLAFGTTAFAQFPPTVEPGKYCMDLDPANTFYGKNYGYTYHYLTHGNFISDVIVREAATGDIVYQNPNDQRGIEATNALDTDYQFYNYGTPTDFELKSGTEYEITVRVRSLYGYMYNNSFYGGDYGPAYFLRLWMDENRNAEWESRDYDQEMIGFVHSYFVNRTRTVGQPTGLAGRFQGVKQHSENWVSSRYNGYFGRTNRVRYYYGRINISTTFNMYESEQTFKYTPKADNPGLTRLRVQTWYFYDYGTRYNFNLPDLRSLPNDACQNGYYSNIAAYYPGYYNYGQTEDYTVKIGGSAGTPWPADQAVIKNATDYDGDSPEYPKFSLLYDGMPQSGATLNYKLVGPLPSSTVVFEATEDANDPNSTGIDLANNVQLINTPDGDKYIWYPNSATPASSYTGTSNGVHTGNGNIRFKKGGEYKIQWSISGIPGGGEYETRFTVANDYDLSASGFVTPLTDKAPTYFKYPEGVIVPLNATVQNTGLNDIKKFDMTIEIEGPNGDIVYEDTYNFDSDNNSIDQVLTSGEKRNFAGTSYWKIFTPNQVGIYKARLSVDYAFDQEAYNSEFARSDQEDYTFEVAYEYENEVTSIETPSSASTIIEGRPFSPEVTLTNNGISVLSDFNILGTYSRWNDNTQQWDRVGTTTYFVNDLPAGAPFNFRTYKLDPYTIADAGTYQVCYKIVSSDVTDPVPDNDELCQEFVVEEGMKGTFTVGTSATSPKHFNTIDDAMAALYTNGVDGPITFLLVDAEYDIDRNGQNEVGMDFTSRIFGLGEKDADGNLKTITWKPAPNRAKSKGGVTLNFNTLTGIGIKFGQSHYNDNEDAVINAYPAVREYMNNAGYITFDGGEQKSIKIVNSVKSLFDNYDLVFNAPVYMGSGSKNITLKNLVIENGSPVTANSVMLPEMRIDVATGGATFRPDRLELDNGANGGVANDGVIDAEAGYSAGIVSRASRNLVNGAIFGNENELLLEMDTIPNSNNMIEGNEISGFGYGIVSIGFSPLVQQQPYALVDYSNSGNVIRDNMISDVAGAGIFLGFEQGTEVSYNRVWNVGGAMSDETAGIVAGGDFAQRVTRDPNTGLYSQGEGYANSGLWIQGNEVSGVTSGTLARGVILEQEKRTYNQDANNPFIYPNKDTKGSTVSSNIVYGLESEGSVAGVHVTTSRMFDQNNATEDVLMSAAEEYRMPNDLIVNNTVIVNPMSTTPDMYVVGIGVQDARNAYVHNNAIAVDGNIGDAALATLVLYQGDNPSATTAVDFNRNVYERGTNDVDIVRFIEKEGSTVISYGMQGEYNTLQQWRAWTGEDKDSYEYMFTQDLAYEQTGGTTEMVIKRTNGELPAGSKLNNTGTRLDDIFTGRNTNRDEEGVLRGEAGAAYDVGALEFRGTSYVFELEALQVQSPSVYMATSGDFSDAQYIMTDKPIDVTALIRNNGSLAGSGLDIKMEIFREDPVTGEFTIPVMEETEVINIRSNTNEEVSFGTADGQGEDFMPVSYYDLIEGGEAYTVPALFEPMVYNVTPRYKVLISTEGDEVNSNNETEAIYRFYVKRASMDMVVSGEELDNDISAAIMNQDLDGIATGYNLSQLQNGLRLLGYVIDTVGALNQELFHYDRFDRMAWEERSIDYTLWNNMFWTDGHSTPGNTNGEDVDRFQALALEAFLMSPEENEFKHNLVIASQDFAWNNPQIASSWLGAASNQAAQTENNSETWELMGESIANGRMLQVGYYLNTNNYPAIKDPNTDQVIPWMAPLAPMPALLTETTPMDGLTYTGINYTNLDPAVHGSSEATFATAVTSITTNQVYLGADWRHIQDIETVLRGVTDYLEANGAEIIPVELTSFEAREVAGTVALTWETASEANSSHFDVERATETGDFMRIGRVEAAGNTASATAYSFGDKGVTRGETYAYRLRMTDRDGSTELSDVRYVTLTGGNDMGLITPNPVTTGTATVTLPELGENAVAMIVNSAGATVQTIELNGQTVLEIDATNLAGGAYNLVVTTATGNHIRPFTVK